MTKTNKLLSWIKAHWWLILPLAPIALLIGLLAHYNVVVPFWDQWESVILFQRTDAGTLKFMDFFIQHNEHRLLFPRTIMYVLAQATGWNVTYEVATSVVFAVTGFTFLGAMLKKTLSNKTVFILSLTLMSFIFFSPLQWENWLWGWQLQWFLNVACVSIALWSLSTWKASPRKRVILAAVAALVAAYALGNGVFVWLVCLPLLWFNKKLRGFIPAWLVVAAISTLTYYIGYTNPAGHPSKLIFLERPVQFVEYLAIYMARPIIFDYLVGLISAAIFFGMVVFLSGYIYKKRKTPLFMDLLPWLCLALYSGLAAVSTDLSRLGFGVTQAYSSRYVTLSNLFLIAVCVGLFKVIETVKIKDKMGVAIKYTCIACVAGITVLVGVNYIKGIEQMSHQHDHLEKAKHCAIHATSSDDACLLILYPNKPVVWERLQYLRTKGWGGTVE